MRKPRKEKSAQLRGEAGHPASKGGEFSAGRRWATSPRPQRNQGGRTGSAGDRVVRTAAGGLETEGKGDTGRRGEEG